MVWASIDVYFNKCIIGMVVYVIWLNVDSIELNLKEFMSIDLLY